jgi:hypothetical protein
MEHFRCHTRMLDRLLATSPTRKNTIASGLMRKNTNCLLSVMAWNGALRKTIEMVTVIVGALTPT